MWGQAEGPQRMQAGAALGTKGQQGRAQQLRSTPNQPRKCVMNTRVNSAAMHYSALMLTYASTAMRSCPLRGAARPAPSAHPPTRSAMSSTSSVSHPSLLANARASFSFPNCRHPRAGNGCGLGSCSGRALSG